MHLSLFDLFDAMRATESASEFHLPRPDLETVQQYGAQAGRVNPIALATEATTHLPEERESFAS